MTKKNWLFLALIITGAIILRVIPQWNNVFVDGQVWFRGVDAWWHMRLADNMAYNFPYPQYWDWYALYPTGVKVGFNPLMSWIISSVGVAGFNYEVFGALLSPIAGGLTLIPVFLIGKELFSKRVGFLACILVAVLPTEFLHRSLLGFADHHALETLLMTTTILFLILMVKRHRMVYAILSGVTLGLYLLNWAGGHFLIAIVLVWFIVQILYFRLKDLPENNFCRDMLIVFLISFFVYLPYMRFINAPLAHYATFFMAIIMPIWMWNRGNKQATLMSLFVPMTIAFIVLYLTDYHRMIIHQLRAVFHGGATTIAEASPSDMATMLNTSGITFFLFVSGIICYFREKNKSWLFILWAIILMAATFGQRRWGYYFVVPMSLLASYFTFHIVNLKWIKVSNRTFATIIIVAFTLMSSIRGTMIVSNLPNNLTSDWYNTLTWVRENTPEPHWEYQGDYYSLKIYDRPHYGILSWWDYGHWITRIAQRPPLSSPAFQDQVEGPRFFCSKTEEEAMQEIRSVHDVRYIIMSADMVGGKYYALQDKAGKDTDLLDSVALKLWRNELETFKLIRQEGEVRLYERIYPPKEVDDD